MNFNMFDNEDASILTDSTGENMQIEELGEMDDFDELEMMPFSASSVPTQSVEMYSNLNIPMYNMAIQQMPIFNINDLNYTDPYMYDYSQDNYIELENEMPDYADITMEQMMEPWEPMEDNMYSMDNMGQIEAMSYNNNPELIQEYNIENPENTRGTIDNYNPRISTDVNEILNKIETFNPEIIHNLMTYGIPYETARKMVRRIIPLTLDYYR